LNVLFCKVFQAGNLFIRNHNAEKISINLIIKKDITLMNSSDFINFPNLVEI
jgi:hypothetical protein